MSSEQLETPLFHDADVTYQQQNVLARSNINPGHICDHNGVCLRGDSGLFVLLGYCLSFTGTRSSYLYEDGLQGSEYNNRQPRRQPNLQNMICQ